jgi:hypothetical protein
MRRAAASVHVGILIAHDLLQPVDEFDVGIATQLAKDGGAFDGLVGQAVQFSEEDGAFDFSHRN